MSYNTLVLGYGNPLRGDDGVGWQAAILVAKALEGQVDVLARHQLTPELAETLSEVDRVIFIDAACEGTPGQVCCRPLACQWSEGQSFTHHVAPADLLATAGALYGHAPAGYLITVNGDSFGYTEALSSVVTDALPEVLEQVRQILQPA
ncbi:MAG: hydrogenase maturation protease [Caldilineaceae bacterium]|nr:hydrogenase maturation protease [Caldilineaceae bacterium]